jgi:predicted RNA binding protein with dsRBD fold (UPF0201 family)
VAVAHKFIDMVFTQKERNEMPKFMIRVELHDADSSEYADLKELLAKRKIGDTIRSQNGKYLLAGGEYHLTADLTANEVLDLVKRTAKTVTPKFSVTVTEADRVVWAGLKEIKE